MLNTRKLSYRKDNRAMRPIYGCPGVPDYTPTVTYPEIFNIDCAYECAYKIWSSKLYSSLR